MKNWQGQEGLSADCKLGQIAVAMMMMGEHPCDRCNMDRKECRGFDRKPEREMHIVNREE